jgi:hypothetical protein
MEEYEKHHILDINIADETQHNGRDVTIIVDTLKMITIEFGNSLTVRTDEAGVSDLRDALDRALDKLDNIRYENVTAAMNTGEDEMIEAGINSRERVKNQTMTEQQLIDVWDPNDPGTW